jgi:type I restriction enzyme M protein
MITGDIKNQIDRIWVAFWSGGISDPLEVIEQITYLLFLRRLDDLHTLEENKSTPLKQPLERRIFPNGKDAKGRPYNDLRWSRFKHLAPAEMYAVVGEHVFPFLRTLGGDESTYGHHMKDARFTIPTPALLAKVVDLLDNVPMADRDTKGELKLGLFCSMCRRRVTEQSVSMPMVSQRFACRRCLLLCSIASQNGLLPSKG